MRKLLILTAILLSFVSVANAQINKIDAQHIKINYDKTMHFIFPSKIKYYNVGNDDVAADRPEGAENILRIKANKKNFSGESNISVVTGDGKFYSYMVAYSDTIRQSYLQIGKQYKQPDSIDVCCAKSTHLIFPDKVKYVDFGNNTIDCAKADNADNIVRIQGKQKNFRQTNISVVTGDGKFYSLNVNFSANPSSYSFLIGNAVIDSTASVAMFDNNEVNENEQEKMAAVVMKQIRSVHHLAAKNNGMCFAIENILVSKNLLFVKAELQNKSSIDYDIDFVKFYIQDKKISKTTAVQEVVYEPLFVSGYNTHIPAHKKNTSVFAFEKFTIPDDKYLIIEIQEANGARHFRFQVENEDLISAKSINFKTK